MTRQSAALSSGAAALHRKRGSTDRHRVGAHAAAFRGSLMWPDLGGCGARYARTGQGARRMTRSAMLLPRSKRTRPVRSRVARTIRSHPSRRANARNLIGRIAIYHQSVGCHPGLAKLIAGTAEVPLSCARHTSSERIQATPATLAARRWRPAGTRGEAPTSLCRGQPDAPLASTPMSATRRNWSGTKCADTRRSCAACGFVRSSSALPERCMRDPSPGEHTSAPPQSPFPTQHAACRPRLRSHNCR